MLQHHFLSPIPQHTLHTRIRNYTLPQNFLQLLQKEGAGYFTSSFIETIEPTRFSLEGTYVNGIFGFEGKDDFLSLLDVKLAPSSTSLPDYFVPFFKDEHVYYCFDYKNSSIPSIRLVDVEMDQWLTIAPNFETLLSHLQLHREEVDYDTRVFLSKHTIQQQLGNFYEENFGELIDVLEETQLEEALLWLEAALHQKNPGIVSLAQDKLEFLMEFRHQDIKNFTIYNRLIELF